MAEPDQACPICGAAVRPNLRYPDCVCADCEARAVDAGGRPVTFLNATPLGGGCQGYFADTDEPFDGEACLIDGVPCVAREARFGGIVIQPAAGASPA